MRTRVIVIVCSLIIVGPAARAADAAPPTHTPMTLQSFANGTMVDASKGSMTEGNQIIEWRTNGSAAQQWVLETAGDRHKIKSNINGGYCLGRDGASVVLRGCGGPHTDWRLDDVGGVWTIRDGDSYLSVADTTPTAGRQLVTRPSDGDAARWYLSDLTVRRRAMPADPRLDQVTFLATHNAMANSEEGFAFLFPNQSYSLRSQLDQGVRALQLDITLHGGQVKMCHGGCWGSERTFTAGLQDVVNFLDANSTAVVTLFIEDYTEVGDLQTAVGKVVGLGDVLFRPDQAGVRQQGWPRVSELVAGNKRLLIFSQRPGREGFGVMYDRDWTVENYWSLGDSGNDQDCYSRWNAIPLNRVEPGFVRLHVMNQYRNIPWVGNAAADNGDKLKNRVERICGPAAQRKPNYVAVDFFQTYAGGTSPLAGVQELNTYW